MKVKVKMAAVVVLALLLAMLAGIMVTRADGPVIWKEYCPMHYEVRQIKDGTGLTVYCIRQAEDR